MKFIYKKVTVVSRRDINGDFEGKTYVKEDYCLGDFFSLKPGVHWARSFLILSCFGLRARLVNSFGSL